MPRCGSSYANWNLVPRRRSGRFNQTLSRGFRAKTQSPGSMRRGLKILKSRVLQPDFLFSRA